MANYRLGIRASGVWRPLDAILMNPNVAVYWATEHSKAVIDGSLKMLHEFMWTEDLNFCPVCNVRLPVRTPKVVKDIMSTMDAYIAQPEID